MASVLLLLRSLGECIQEIDAFHRKLLRLVLVVRCPFKPLAVLN